MMTGTIVGDRELVAALNAAGPKVKAAIDAEVQKLGYALQLRVQSDWLRGPRPTRLGVVTGRLLRSITQGAGDSRSRFVSTATTAYAYVGTNVEYGAPWEYGFQRKIGAGSRGGPRTLMGKALQTYIAKHPPGVKNVGARPFLAPALEEFKPIALRELTAAANNAMAAALKP
jgi:phage gpG-like protein